MSDLDVSKMKVAELRAELQERGLDTKGVKAVLQARLREALDAEEAGSPAPESIEDEDQVDEVAEEATEVSEQQLEQEDETVEPEPRTVPEDEMPEDVMEDDPQPDQEAEQVDVKQEDEAMQEEQPAEEEEQPAEEEEQMEVKDEVEEEPAESEVKEEVSEVKVEQSEVKDEQSEVKDEPSEEITEVKDEFSNGDFEVKDEVTEIKDDADDEVTEVKDEDTKEAEKKEGKDVKRDDRDRERRDDRDRGRKDRKDRSPRRRSPPPVVMDEDDGIPESQCVLSKYISDLNMKIAKEGYSASPLSMDGFGFLWSGVRATHGVTKGKVCFQVKLTEHNNVKHLGADEKTPHVVRVGWSMDKTSLQLGEEPLSYGYGGTGKFSTNCKFENFGEKFTEGDVITAYLDMEGEKPTISYAKNDTDLGVAHTIADDLGEDALFPHILVKNTAIEVNLGQMEEPFFPVTEGFTFIGSLPEEDRVRGPVPPAEKKDCEIVMMVGLPGAGKTTWAEKFVKEHPEKKYYQLGTNLIMDKMKVMGLRRSRNYAGRFDSLIDKSTRCLNRFFEMAPRKKRNYILDQTNVYPSARRRKMRPFEGFSSKAIVLVPTDEEFKKRIEKRTKEEGKDVPDHAVLEMKANFELPVKGELFDEVEFVDQTEDEAKPLVEKYKKEGIDKLGPNYRRNRDRRGGIRDNRNRNDNRSQRGGNRGGGSQSRGGGNRYGGGGYNSGGGGGGYNKGYGGSGGGGYNDRNRSYGGRGGSGGYGNRSSGNDSYGSGGYGGSSGGGGYRQNYGGSYGSQGGNYNQNRSGGYSSNSSGGYGGSSGGYGSQGSSGSYGGSYGGSTGGSSGYNYSQYGGQQQQGYSQQQQYPQQQQQQYQQYYQQQQPQQQQSSQAYNPYANYYSNYNQSSGGYSQGR